jgi:hypothetical protein
MHLFTMDIWNCGVKCNEDDLLAKNECMILQYITICLPLLLYWVCERLIKLKYQRFYTKEQLQKQGDHDGKKSYINQT